MMELNSPFPDTQPYPWPYDGVLDIATAAVVLCGWQASFADVGDPAARAAAAELAGAWADSDGLVVTVAHCGEPARPAWLPSPGSMGAAALPAPDGALSLTAFGWDATFGSPLEVVLRGRGITHVLLAGLAAEATVDSTVRTLNDRGFECLVLTDACTAIDPDLLAHAQHSLTMSGGIFGALGCATDVLHSLALSVKEHS
jgi:nicotinamidase-related amidase